MKHLKIIDGNALLFRAYFASAYSGANLTTKDGTPTNAVYVFANMLQKILFPVAPETHILVAFDTGEKTFRHQQLESYKAHRKPVPEDLIKQFPIARALLKALNLFTFEQDGFEGDDVAGSAALLAIKAGIKVDIFTSDRDFLQLVQPNLTVQIIRKGVSETVAMTREKVIADYGITPEQVPDFKGLVGDASDNLPGIPGVGEKTATKLLQEYGTFEAVLSACANLKTKTAANIITYQADGLLSKKLAMIDTQMALPFSIEKTLYTGIDPAVFDAFINQYEMRSLANRFQMKSMLAVAPITYATLTALPEKVSGPLAMVPILELGNYLQNPLHSFALSYQDHHFIIHLEDAQKDSFFLQACGDDNVEKLVYDYKQLLVLGHRYGIQFSGPYFDTMMATYALDETPSLTRHQVMQQHGLNLAEDITIQAFQIAGFLSEFKTKLQEDLKVKQLENIVYDIEFPLIPILAAMEIEGMPIDVAYLHSMEVDLAEKITSLSKQIYTQSGSEFNLDSPKQLKEILFDKLALPNPKKGSTNIDVLKQLEPLHPVIALIMDYRKFAKLQSTYVKSLQSLAYPDGKLHPLYQQAHTTTGRLSSFDPNIQNIAVKDEETKLIRKAFYYPDQEHVLVSFDYSQIELRILAELSQCQPLIDAFVASQDIHTITAKRLFAQGGDVTSLMRRQAKAINFGIIYGMSAWGLSEQLGINPSEAQSYIDAFYTAYPELKTYMQTILEGLLTDKYVTTLLGRRRYLRDISGSNFQAREFAKRAAMNAPIQGTAADLIKLAMVKVSHALKAQGFATKLILTIHDELIFKTPRAEITKVMPLIQHMMESALPLKVPLKVEGHYADNWYDLK
jgi:DNA polymerase-1